MDAVFRPVLMVLPHGVQTIPYLDFSVKVSGLKEALSKSAFHWLVTMCRSPASKDLDTCYNDATVNTPQKDSLVYKFKSGPAGRWCHAPLIPGSL